MTVRIMLAVSTALLIATTAHAQSTGSSQPIPPQTLSAEAAATPGPQPVESGPTSAPVEGQPASSDRDETQSSGLVDIVVTAQRREQSLQKVPIAVTALDSGALADLRVTNVERLSGFAPNLLITTQNIPSLPVVTIRGINSGVTNVVQDPKVGLYLDGVYIGRNSGSIFDLADIERVEVLRGPQGTLFGRNATAGAISLVTAAPSGELGGRQLLSYGNYGAFRSRTVLNLPAFGPF